MPDMVLSSDAHSRVAILFELKKEHEDDTLTLIAISVKGLVIHGTPLDPHDNTPLKYHGTYIIQ